MSTPGVADAFQAKSPIDVPLWIGGEARETGAWLDVKDPAFPERLVGRAALADAALTREAIGHAEQAARAWGKLSPSERVDRLKQAMRTLEEVAGETAELLVRENGKILREAQVDVAVFSARTALAAGLIDELEPERLSYRAGAELPVSVDGWRPTFRTEVAALPVGVVSIIVPYNWPLAILSASLPYALVAGNAVIVKPPPTAPLAVSRLLHRLASALPKGLLSVVSGNNEAVAPLIVDRRVGRVVFTGSTTGGRAIMQAAAGNLTRLTLELGGNDPAVVLDDASLDRPELERLTRACFLTAGQVCMAVKRVYVHESRYAELVDGLASVLSGQRLGHGLQAGTTMGPLNTARQRDFVQALCAEAQASGAEVREFGDLAGDVASGGGYFLKPRLVLSPRADLRIVTEEQFGPAIPILPFSDVDRLIEGLNAEPYGLGSSVWSSDLRRASRIAGQLRMGTTWINNASAMAIDDRAPFGGFRQSGLGREMGRGGVREFTELHTVTLPG